MPMKEFGLRLEPNEIYHFYLLNAIIKQHIEPCLIMQLITFFFKSHFFVKYFSY